LKLFQYAGHVGSDRHLRDLADLHLWRDLLQESVKASGHPGIAGRHVIHALALDKNLYKDQALKMLTNVVSVSSD
jgi:hypothetical protein